MSVSCIFLCDQAAYAEVFSCVLTVTVGRRTRSGQVNAQRGIGRNRSWTEIGFDRSKNRSPPGDFP